jgi:hypothetical protein
MNKNIIASFLFFLLWFYATAQTHSLLERKYKEGEVFRYSLTMTQYNDGKWNSTLISVCELRTVRDSSGVPYDEVQWISKKTLTAKDTILQDDEARSVKPFRISLDPRGSIKIPKIEIPGMTEPIQDFITFFVAVSPRLGTTELKKKGDSVVNSNLVKADFSNGHPIIFGNDCFRVTKQLIDVNKKKLILKVSFLPPAAACFNYILDEMKTPVVKDTANNFQMLQEVGKDKLNVQYGNEQFIINSADRRSDGKIIFATMSNTLRLALKMNCDKEYKNCSNEFHFTMQRNLELKLLK